MGHDASALHAGIDDGRREADRHRATVDSMQSMGEMAAEMEAHAGAMDDVMTSMDGAMEGMSGCMGGSPMTDMMEKMSMMASMMDEHDEAMAGADDLPRVRAESNDHHAAMMGLLDGMQVDADEMACAHMR